MLLIIPSLELKGGICARSIRGINEDKYSPDPVEIAKLWRMENAKALHITDIDGAQKGYPVHLDVVRSIVSKIDIPVELGGGIRTLKDAEHAISSGVYRITIGTVFIDNPEEARKILDKFGASKVTLGINAKNFHVQIKGGEEDSCITPISTVINAQECGFKRAIYTDVIEDEVGRRPRFDAIKLLAERSKMHLTISGGIRGLDDLLKLQEYEPLGIDSVIIGRALYENKFSCQNLWRVCEVRNFPYTAKV